MPRAKLVELKRELFSKKKRTRDGFHEQPWLVEHWPEYVERTFEKAPKDLMSQLRKIVNDKATPKVEAHKVRGQEVKPIDARPLGDLELAKLSGLLKEYEKKWEAMGEASQVVSNQISAGNEDVKDAVHDRADEILEAVREVKGFIQGKGNGKGKTSLLLRKSDFYPILMEIAS